MAKGLIALYVNDNLVIKRTFWDVKERRKLIESWTTMYALKRKDHYYIVNLNDVSRINRVYQNKKLIHDFTEPGTKQTV